MHLSIHVPEDLVGIGEEKEKGDGFVFVISKPTEFGIQDRFCLLHEFVNRCWIHWCEVIFEQGPCFIVYLHGVIYKFIRMFVIEVPEAVMGAVIDPFSNFPEALRERLFNVDMKTELPV